MVQRPTPSSQDQRLRKSPVLILALVLLMLVGGLEILRLYVVDDGTGVLSIDRYAGTPEVFREAHSTVKGVMDKGQKHQSEQDSVAGSERFSFGGAPVQAAAPQSAPATAVPTTALAPEVAVKAVSVPVFEHNQRKGSITAPLRLVVFQDPSCASCRAQVAQVERLLLPFRNRLQVAYKFLPQQDDQVDGGVFPLMVNQEKQADLLSMVQQQSGDLAAEDWVALTEQSGISLADQRRLMSRNMRNYLAWIQQDIRQAADVDVAQTPAFFLNGYRVGSAKGLAVENLPIYAERLLKGLNPQSGDKLLFRPTY